MSTFTNPPRLYFQLDGFDPWHRQDWEEHLDTWFKKAPSAAERTHAPEDAEWIIEPSGIHSFIDGQVFRVARQSYYHLRPESTFAWDWGDFPTGLLPGLFCSLGQRLFDPARHRGFCYPLPMNRLVHPCAADDARYLFGFSGNITSPLRGRLFQTLQPEAVRGKALLRRTECLFYNVYDPAADADRARYAEDLAQCRFVLCPRGNGLSSIRLFECMKAARVPVIISDALVLPQCVDWASCSIRVRERDMDQLPQILSQHEPEWLQLAQNARKQWELYFSDSTLLQTLVTQLRGIVEGRSRPEGKTRRLFPFRILQEYAIVQAKTMVRRLRNTRVGGSRRTMDS